MSEAMYTDDQIEDLLEMLGGWARDGEAIVRTFSFETYCEVLSFVNAAAWVAHRADHHPDISFGYKTCTVRYSTHHAGGLTEQDFTCAARVNALVEW